MVDERRSEERYAIKRAVVIRESGNRSEAAAGCWSRNISSKGILVELNGSDGVRMGQLVHVEIDLGTLDESGRPVQVMSRGSVIRCEKDAVAIQFNGKSQLVQK